MTVLDYVWFIGIPVVFVLVVLFIMRPRAKSRYRKHSEIPFDEPERKKRKRK